MDARSPSIGTRLGVGFGAVLAVLLAFAVATVYLQDMSAQAQEEALHQALPARDAADRLEQAMLYVAIAVRNAFLEPGAPARERAAARITEARSAREAFEARSLAGLDAARRRSILAGVDHYLDTSAALVAAGDVDAGSQAALSVMREDALAPVREIMRAQDERWVTAIGRMAEARERIRAGMAGAVLATIALLLLVAWLTTRSVREPARRLSEVAAALRDGHWAPAVALAPPAGNAEAPRSELARIAQGFGAAAVALQARERELGRLLEELQAQNEELQHQREEIEARNEELREQSAALAEADARKNDFLALLAHELRNPLAALRSAAHLMEHPQHAARAREISERQMTYLTRLIEDLLDVARMSRGKLRLHVAPLDLAELLRHCAEDVPCPPGQAACKVDLQLPPGPVPIEGDRTRLAQVFGNLLGNAVKFSEAGGTIHLALRIDDAAREAVIEIRDHGMGMSPELMERLFVPFSQGEPGPGQGRGGLGLGLALARALLELHGGRIEAHSDGPGRGSRFVVTLPLR